MMKAGYLGEASFLKWKNYIGYLFEVLKFTEQFTEHLKFTEQL